MQIAASEPKPVVDVGRSDELARLIATVARAAEGSAAAAMVSGPAGIGKTWLLDALVSGTLRGTDPPLVLRASAHPAEHDLPYAGLHQLVAPVVEAIGELPTRRREALHAALAMAALEPHDSFAAASGLLQLVADRAEDRPVVVVVDDLQWLDPSSYQALVFLCRRLRADRVAVILSGRDAPDTALASLGEHLELGPLDDPTSRAIVRAVQPRVSAGTLDAIVDAAAGLPLALREIPAELTTEQLTGESSLPVALPVGARLGELYAGRLATLDADSMLALLIVSLEPLNRIRLDQVLAQVGLPLEALEPVEAARLITVDADGARLVHPTLAAAVQGCNTERARRRSHAALAEVLADQPSRRAWHLDAVTDGPNDSVAVAFAAAADDAEARSAWLLAGHAHDAAARRSTGADRSRFHLGRAAMAFARAGASIPLIEALTRLAAATDDPAERLMIETDLLTARIWSPPEDIDVPAVCATAERLAPACPTSAARLLTMLALGLVIAGRPDEAVDQLDAARALIADTGSCGGVELEPELAMTWDVVRLHLGGSGGEVLRGPWDESLTDAQLTEPSLALLSATTVLIWGGWPSRAQALLERQCAALVDAGAFGLLGVYHGLLAAAFVLRGDWLRARAHFARGISLCEDTDLRGPLPHIQMRSAYLHAALGDGAACRELMGSAKLASRGSPLVEHMDACVLGLLALGEGRCEEAVDLLSRAGAWEREVGLHHPGYTTRAGDLAEALWRLRRTDELEVVVAEHEERALLAGSAGPLALAARGRALLAGPAAIDDAFGRAIEWHEQTEDDFETARTELCWGRRLRRARRKRDARPHLHAALDCFERLDAHPWAAQARSELAACGERRAAGRARGAGLTPRELEVALLVARGASNPEAAADLCISRRTVEDHLGRIYRKLGVHDRNELATALGDGATLR